MLKSKSKFYYSKLDEENKKIYDNILSAWEAKKSSASFSFNPLNKNNDVQKVLEFIKLDNPGLFYIDFKQIAASGFASMMTINTSFLYTNKQIDDMEKQIETIISSVLSIKNFNSLVPPPSLKSEGSPPDNYSKEIVIYDFIVKNTSYSFGVTNDETTSIVGALLSKKAVCEGYSKALKLLCDNFGLSCIIVTGKAKPHDRPKECHAWNIIKIDGSCAHVDATWDSNNRGSSDTCYDNFNLTDDDASKDHFWDKKLLPACKNADLNYYFKNGLCADNRNEFMNIIKAQAKTGKKIISLKMTGKEASNDKLMKAANEALTGITKPGQRIGFRYSPNRRVATIQLI